MKKVIGIFVSICFVFFIIYTFFASHSQASIVGKDDGFYYNEEDSLDGEGMALQSSKSHKAPPIDTDPDSIKVLVNKDYALAADYIPKDLVVPNVLFNISYYDEKKLLRQEAATAIESLFNAAAKDGITLYAISGYRSYDRQKEIYDTNVATKGLEYTNRYSAMPGHSEHQTGLGMDVSALSVNNSLDPVFAYSNEGIWLAAHAHSYGFVIRYPENKESVTGYSYEPWHIRYVGKKLASYLYQNHLTLEEYYDYTPSNSDMTAVSYDNVVEIDTSTKKKEITPPTKEEIEKVQKEETKDPATVTDPAVDDTKDTTDADVEDPSQSNVTPPAEDTATDEGSAQTPIKKPDTTTPPTDTTTPPADTPTAPDAPEAPADGTTPPDTSGTTVPPTQPAAPDTTTP